LKPTKPIAGQQFEYAFDDIGNRKYANSGGDGTGANLRTQSYTVNNLNQYTQRTLPGYVDVLGAATNTADVVVNNRVAYRKGDYYRQELTVANSTAAVWQGVTNVGFLPQSTNSEIISGTTGSIFVAQSPESFGFDLDGNQTNDGRWSFFWDAQNRLTNMVSLSSAPVGSKRKLDFTYDCFGRRSQKVISTNNGSSYVGQYTNKLIYDGWNVVAILDGGNNLLYSFRWGIDASGTSRGAGGVGGLISMTVHSGSLAGVYFYCLDGNHNVVGLVNAADGTVAAQYEYGPFGQLLRATGPLAFANPFRFSARLQDDESGLLYYGFRYYNPSTGRWLSRDPVEISDDLNPYGFVNNRPGLVLDFVGLFSLHFKGDWSASQQRIAAQSFQDLSKMMPSLNGDVERGMEKARKLPDKCAYKAALLKALAEIQQTLKNVKSGLDGKSDLDLYFEQFDQNVGVQVPPPYTRKIVFNAAPLPKLYFFTLPPEGKMGTLLHEITHIRSVANLEDEAREVWKTGPFYGLLTVGKDPLNIWGHDLLNNVKKGTGQECCPDPSWPHNPDGDKKGEAEH
jgi:RHS repeat-associated protein